MRESAIRESHGKGESTAKDQHEIEVLDGSKHGFQNKTLECAKPFVVSFNSTLTRVGKGKQMCTGHWGRMWTVGLMEPTAEPRDD